MNSQENREPGLADQSIIASNYPLQDNSDRFQSETGVARGFKIESRKMPTIEFTGSKEPATVGSVDVVKTAANRNLQASVDQVRPSDTNLRTQFIKPNDIDSRGSFGKG